jgi:hypothetical protein
MYMAKLKDFCTLIRSKNAGPFTLTFDIMFKDLASFKMVERSNTLTKELFEALFHEEKQNITLVFHERALAAKISFPRPHFQCDLDDNDCYGGQQYATLVDIEINPG